MYKSYRFSVVALNVRHYTFHNNVHDVLHTSYRSFHEQNYTSHLQRQTKHDNFFNKTNTANNTITKTKNDNNNYVHEQNAYPPSSSGWPINPSSSSSSSELLTVQGRNNMEMNKSVNVLNESNATRTFWMHPVKPVNLNDEKRQHLIERTLDKQSRFTVRNQLREDGVVSNLFPIYFPEENAHAASEICPLYIYEMYATRQVRSNVTTVVHQNKRGDVKMTPHSPSHSISSSNVHKHTNNSKRNGSTSSSKNNSNNNNNNSSSSPIIQEQRVNPGPTWRAVKRCLQKHFIKLPPMVQLDHKIYTNGPLPTEILHIPPEFHDLGWLTCEIRLLGRFTFADLKPEELQQVVNKIVPWSAREYFSLSQSKGSNNSNKNNTINKNGLIDSFAVVRDRIGKLVSTSEGITAEGLRLFRGTLVQAIFVDDSAASKMTHVPLRELPRRVDEENNNNNNNKHLSATHTNKQNDENENEKESFIVRPQTRHLAELRPGMSDPSAPPIHFYVDRYIRSLNFKGQDVDSYEISDASGKYFASYWSPVHSPALKEGHVYAATNVHLRVFEKPSKKYLVEFTQGKSIVTEVINQSSITIESSDNNYTNDMKKKKSKESTEHIANINKAQTSARKTNLFSQGQTKETTHFPGRLALKIDSKGTIGSDTSLWEEVRNHFGPGPYDEETQRRISLSVSGTPVVISYSLRQSVVRAIRFGVQLLGPVHTSRTFNFTDPEQASLEPSTTGKTNVHNRESLEAQLQREHQMKQEQLQMQKLKGQSTEHASYTLVPQNYNFAGNSNSNSVEYLAEKTLRAFHRNMDAELLAVLPYLDPEQPYAVLADYTVLPLQVLHCCFDPRMKNWQDLGIAHLSLMPQQRMALLMQFRHMLSIGLAIWGLKLGHEPWRSHALSLLPLPMKTSTMSYKQYVQTSSQNQLSSGIASANNANRHPMPQAHPSTMIVIGIYGNAQHHSSSEEEKNSINITVQRFARYFSATYVTCVNDETEAVKFMSAHALTAPISSMNTSLSKLEMEKQRRLKDPHTALILITRNKDSRATRWVMAECLSRGIVPLPVAPLHSANKLNLLCGNISRQLLIKFECNPLRGIDIHREMPAIAHRRLLVIGVDSCHTNEMSTGSIVGLMITPWRNHLISHFWKHDARGREVQHTADNFTHLLSEAVHLYDGLDEVIIFQDGDVYSELNAMHEEIKKTVPRCGLTFMCLHKRCNIRFVHDGMNNTTPISNNNYNKSVFNPSEPRRFHNIVKGAVIPALTPVPLDYDLAAPSFYMQTHESLMSTARIVQYTVHHTSPTMEITDVQQLANVMANVLAPQPTKLPMPTRCAHKLADKAERLLDAVPQLTCDLIPDPLRQRLWYL